MTAQELNERQHWTLNQKIDHSLGTIESFVTRVGGLDKVYLSFSGGKDSTVLLHLARWIFPNILAVFCSTGNEYPEIVQFVNQTKRGGGIWRLSGQNSPLGKYGLSMAFRWLVKKLPRRYTEYVLTPILPLRSGGSAMTITRSRNHGGF